MGEEITRGVSSQTRGLICLHSAQVLQILQALNKDSGISDETVTQWRQTIEQLREATYGVLTGIFQNKIYLSALIFRLPNYHDGKYLVRLYNHQTLQVIHGLETDLCAKLQLQPGLSDVTLALPFTTTYSEPYLAGLQSTCLEALADCLESLIEQWPFKTSRLRRLTGPVLAKKLCELAPKLLTGQLWKVYPEFDGWHTLSLSLQTPRNPNQKLDQLIKKVGTPDGHLVFDLCRQPQTPLLLCLTFGTHLLIEPMQEFLPLTNQALTEQVTKHFTACWETIQP